MSCSRPSINARGQSPASYSRYLAGTDLRDRIKYGSNGYTYYAYEADSDVLAQVRSEFGGTTLSQYDYTTDAAGRRTEIARSGTAMTEARADAYGYNARNELTSAAKLGGPAAVPADEYAYQYDDIGNRVASTDLGTNRTYTANFLNQYTLISNLCDSVTLCDDFVPQYDLDGNQTLVKTSTGVWHKIHGDSPRATPKSGWPRKEQVDLRYDEETNHGANPDKQKEWGEKWPTLN